ncbi:tetratricopeptide repeat protein [Telmatospirillum siberiense]|nr:tetratricopeptide repeat-containing glycosyltransferase family protein [Telmatospirillum siberiense]
MDRTVRAAIISAISSGDLPRAVRTAHGILESEGHYEGYFALVTALLDGGHPEMAVQYFAVLRDALPGHSQVAYGYGLALQRTGRLEEAIAQWRQAVALSPDFVDACRNLAMGLIDTGRDGEAEFFLQKLLGVSPRDAEALLHLGNIAFRRGAMADARARYQDALRITPHLADAWTNLGEAERSLGRLAEAEICLREALNQSPESRQAHFNLAALLLEQGRWGEGFEHFQWRANLSRIPGSLAELPLWSADHKGAGRVALWNDQGLGDAILFLRYAARLKARGVHVTAVLQPSLTRLAATVSGVDDVCSPDGALPSFDCQAPLASLPHLLGEPDPGMTAPYLPVGPSKGRAGTSRSIGLVWAAGADSPNGRERSLSLDDLAPLSILPDIVWHSLQMGVARETIAASAWSGILGDSTSEIRDFADTAALIEELDLVISVDTSVAHLAGAMGKPVWIPLSHPSDWKWGRDGEVSACYPSAVLFRQNDAGDWRPVVSRMAAALERGT